MPAILLVSVSWRRRQLYFFPSFFARLQATTGLLFTRGRSSSPNLGDFYLPFSLFLSLSRSRSCHDVMTANMTSREIQTVRLPHLKLNGCMAVVHSEVYIPYHPSHGNLLKSSVVFRVLCVDIFVYLKVLVLLYGPQLKVQFNFPFSVFRIPLHLNATLA